MKKQYDIIVVGAGPVGSTAARITAQNGASVLMLEKDREIGIPVRCAEGVSEAGLKLVVDPQPHWIAKVIKGAYLYAPNGKRVVVEKHGIGYVLHRKLFDADLAKMAAEKGAEVKTRAYVYDLIRDNGNVCGVKMKYQGRDYQIKSKIVIGADGIESRVGRWAGLSTHMSLHDTESCAQITAVNIDVENEYCHFFFSTNSAPGGYAWVFPKGNGIANIGLGISGDYAKEKNALLYLNEFVAERFPDASVINTVVGGAPCAVTLKRIVTNGCMLIGDAARQANPVSGGGIVSGMIAAQIAAEVAVDALKKGDNSSKFLNTYEKRWHDRQGKAHERFYRIKEAIFRLTDDELNKTAESLLNTDSEKRTLLKLFTTALIKQPKLILEAAKVFK